MYLDWLLKAVIHVIVLPQYKSCWLAAAFQSAFVSLSDSLSVSLSKYNFYLSKCVSIEVSHINGLSFIFSHHGRKYVWCTFFAAFVAAPGEQKHDVLVSAYMNSGSRFTGRLLGYLPDSFYFYEPLWKFALWDYFRPPNKRCSTIAGDCRSVSVVTKTWVIKWCIWPLGISANNNKSVRGWHSRLFWPK